MVLSNLSDNGYAEGSAQHSVQGRAETDQLYGAEYGLGVFPLGLMFPHGKYDLPPWNHPERDPFLKRAYRSSTLFSAIVFGESARVKNADYQLTVGDDSQPTLARYQSMLATCDFGRGFGQFRSKLATDILTQDNGGFIELLSNGDDRSDPHFTERPLEGRPDNFAYMDSQYCWRTPRPDYPVIYWNPYTGQERILHWTRVLDIVQFPQGDELGRGRGLCALARSYEAGRIAIQTNQYTFEKITGSAPDIFVTNMPFKGMAQGLLSSQLDAKAKGFEVFRDPVVLSPLAGGVGAQGLTIERLGLKSTPDGFDRRDEHELAIFMVMAGFGVDAREYFPGLASGQTKADAEIQSEKAVGKGIEDVLNAIEWVLNWRVFPPEVTLEFKRSNSVTERYDAENRRIRVQTRMVQLRSGELSVGEARRLAAKDGDIDPAFLEETEGEERTVADDTEDVGTKAASPWLVNSLRQDLLGASSGTMSRRQFAGRLRQDMMEMVSRAYTEGLREAGYNLRDGLTEEMRGELAQMVELQQAYAADLSNFVFRDDPPGPEEINKRVKLWRSKAVGQTYNMGKVAGAPDRLWRWRLGATIEHCATCLAADGQVHSAKAWRAKGILPQANTLECGGFHCDCRLEDATGLPVDTDDVLAGVPTFYKSYKGLAPHEHQHGIKEDSFKPTQAMAEAARRGLRLRDAYGRGGTRVGIARARDIANRRNLSADTVHRMVSFFARHSAYKKNHKKDPPSNSYISWLLWGGDPGEAWAKRKEAELNG